jgi:hypothetical protein
MQELLVAVLAPCVEIVRRRHGNSFRFDWVLPGQADCLTNSDHLRKIVASYLNFSAIHDYNSVVSIWIGLNAVFAVLVNCQRSICRIDLDLVVRTQFVNTKPHGALL